MSEPAAIHAIPPRRAWTMFLALVFASAACLTLIAARFARTGDAEFQFLIKNLFLAWIPMVFSLGAYYLHTRAAPGRFKLLICALIWFLFFPNAPYIITDFIHLGPQATELLWYFDLLIMMSFAWTGLFLGFLSLYLMQEIARVRYGARVGWCFTTVMLALSSFGVYLGRFGRWNSWDVLRNPIGLLSNPFRNFGFMSHPHPFYFSATLFVFLLLSYCALYSLTRLHESVQGEPDGLARP